ncbi:MULTISPECIES: hypothetical protein [Citrobacter]|uniref:Uncharacterized protein n=1 Tax=Citrobacter braakii TaxID=57706 RepID=A0ABR6TTG7_CITBR|nr:MULTISPECIES: hypothetical protein [Citrobacter]MBC2610090.1 hypothetical protein [Citrobacter braakii]MBC2634130.1 hypothetical protein [Citrobacter braakii]MBC2646849.1 hypothetical protein [Citrobacter braakii]MDM3430687.1 hypothetical protein [Citrobacter sp. Cb023]MDM3437601.1 hypothetical protein [Citrobacter sp. Cb034]
MDANYIAYQTLVANRAAAEWAFWSMVVASVSVVTTIVTLCFAYKALSTWRDQEKTKVKLDFRNAIKQLKTALLFMPLSIDPDELEQEREQVIAKWLFKDVDLINQQIEIGEQNVRRFDELLSIFDSCRSSWLATEHLFDNTKLSKDWVVFEGDFERYIKGNGYKSSLMQQLDEMMTTRFVFESK